MEEKNSSFPSGSEESMILHHNGCIFYISFIMLLMGCVAGISQPSRSKVTFKGSFSTLQKKPDAYKGEVIMLGGRIINTKSSSTLSQLTVLQLDLSFRGRPKNSDHSEGRFIIQTMQNLDPEIYKKDRLLTVVGTLKGSKVLPIGDFKYAYPLVELIEIKLWPKEIQTQPQVYFGIGVGTSF